MKILKKIISFLIIIALTLSIKIDVFADTIPSYYNIADNYNVLVEDQGNEGNCWAFASIKTLETYLQMHG